MADPLNPALYRALQQRFGSVLIRSEGESAVLGGYVTDPTTGHESLDVRHPGEYYAVSCPFCSDTRHRLYVNHLWGVRDARGYRNLWLAVCYNEKCLQTHPERRQELMDMITATDGELSEVKIKPGKVIDPDTIEIAWPGPVTRIDKLPAGHKGREYVRSRGFDPDRIGRYYGVCYCHDSAYWLARDRLIIPIYQDRVLRGWQARYIGEMNWKAKDAPPKYWTAPGTPRRMLIYNLDRARQYDTGVIVEGPTDVWAFGPMAVCTLGATMTQVQRAMFHAAFKNKKAVLLYDPDRKQDDSVAKVARALEEALPGSFAQVWLPDGTDPGGLGRGFLRSYVAQEADRAGLKVSWSKQSEGIA